MRRKCDGVGGRRAAERCLVTADEQGVRIELDPAQILADLAEVPKKKPTLQLVKPATVRTDKRRGA